MKKLIKAETSLSLILSIIIFAIIILSYIKWQSQHNKENGLLFQQQQALQIAENQIALKMADRGCEKRLFQNNQTFEIQCSENEIKVHFPTGKIVIGNSF